MTNELYTVNDIFKDWKNTGIFSTLSNNYDVPWDKTRAKFLDWAYHGNRSGDKFVAPLVMQVLEDDGTLTEDNYITLCGVAFMKYGDNWARLFKADSSVYNPIDNYSMSEEGTDTITHDNTRSNTGADTITHNTVIENEGSNTNTSNESTTASGKTEDTKLVYGFDSTTGQNSDKNTGTTSDTGKREATTTGSASTTETHTGTDKTDRNNTEKDSGTTETKHTLTRSGNIGVTTSAQMLEQEHTLWGDWSIFEKIFKDIDDIFTIGIFADKSDPCGRYTIVKQYTLPQATETQLGGVKVAPAIAEQTSFVGIDSLGRLVYAAGGTGAVASVNGKTGVVVLDYDDVKAVAASVYATDIPPLQEAVETTFPNTFTALSNAIKDCYSPNNPPEYPVKSVFGQTGDIRPIIKYRVVQGAITGMTSITYDTSKVSVITDLSDYVGHTVSIKICYARSNRNANTYKRATGVLNEGVTLDDVDYSMTGQFTLDDYISGSKSWTWGQVVEFMHIVDEKNTFVSYCLVDYSNSVNYIDTWVADITPID